MNSSLRPIPASTPFLERARLMHQRGEAKSFQDACAALRSRRHHGHTAIHHGDRQAFENVEVPPRTRLWYRDA